MSGASKAQARQVEPRCECALHRCHLLWGVQPGELQAAQPPQELAQPRQSARFRFSNRGAAISSAATDQRPCLSRSGSCGRMRGAPDYCTSYACAEIGRCCTACIASGMMMLNTHLVIVCIVELPQPELDEAAYALKKAVTELQRHPAAGAARPAARRTRSVESGQTTRMRCGTAWLHAVPQRMRVRAADVPPGLVHKRQLPFRVLVKLSKAPRQ